MALACEDANSKLVEVVTVADVDSEDHVGTRLQLSTFQVWDMVSPTEINLRRVLVGHRAAVNVVDFDDKYIVSASGDRTIKVDFLSLEITKLCQLCLFRCGRPVLVSSCAP